ncbi:ATP-binding cassette domain-containing protein [Rummeliibacillus pycnus]|uniref:ATP-binding cassette domain-containing protein n=1 Tax=Rummeliibacillus pycnus TaxID=101070 RepID=UPI0037CC8DB8
MKELVKFYNISFQFRDQLLFENINASIQVGEIIGVIGKNGAEKSTLLQLIQANLMPSKGQLQLVQKLMTSFYVKQKVES